MYVNPYIKLCIGIMLIVISSLLLVSHYTKANKVSYNIQSNIDSYYTVPHVAPLSEIVYRYKSGEVIGILEIKRLNMKLPVHEGPATNSLLKKGITTVHKNELYDNNIAIAGHTEQNTSLFFTKLHKIKKNDVITLKYNGKLSKYVVVKKQNVTPDRVDVLNESNDEQLTLVTCDDYNPITQKYNTRMIVIAKKAS